MIAGVITIQVLDSKGNQIGTGTGTLPCGGNVVINISTKTVGAMIVRPPLSRGKSGTVVAEVAPKPTMPTIVTKPSSELLTSLLRMPARPAAFQGVHP